MIRDALWKGLRGRSWSFNPGLLEDTTTWGLVGVLAASAVACTGASFRATGEEEGDLRVGGRRGKQVTRGIKKPGTQSSVFMPFLHSLDMRQQQAFGG